MKEAFYRVVDLAVALDPTPLSERASRVIEIAVDEHWRVVLNGDSVAHAIPMYPQGPALAPWSVYVEWNGFPAGLLDAGGGVIAAGEAANEATLIAALVAAKARVEAEAAQP